MDVGIGLPATIPGVEGKAITEWARRAEDRGFTTLGTIDRTVYPNYEPLLCLAAASAVTERIKLMTSVALVPLRANIPLLAKELATLDNLSGGRFVFGAGLGARDDDYAAGRIDTSTRGQAMDAALTQCRAIWAGEAEHAVGPKPLTDGGPPIVVGGSVDASFRRAAEHGAGWIMGGGTPDQLKDGAEKTRKAWEEAGRDGEPRIMGLFYYALGEGAEENADRYLKDYYGIMGDEVAQAIASSAATDEDTVEQYVQAYADAGADEMIAFPCSTDVEQADLLADAAL